MPARFRYLIVPVALVALLVGTQAARTADSWPVPRGQSREPAPYRYDPKDWAQVPQEFREEASAVILYSGTTHIIDSDGTVETTTHEVTRLNGRKGVEALGEYHGIFFDPAYQKLTLNEARVLKTDGTIVSIEPKHIQVRDVATDYQIYDQDKQMVISFPNLEVGDVYEVKWTVRGKNPEFAGKFFTRYTFGDDTYPVVRDELHVLTGPDQMLRHGALNGAVDLKIAERNGQKHYHWQVANRPPPPREDDRPSKEEFRLQVACSTFASWEEVAQWKQKLRAECWECAPSVKKIVEEVTRGQMTPLEKARVLTYWVRTHIRYVSRGPAGTGYTPHLPHLVMTNLFGDCKDQAQLLAVMLREIGLAPYLVTLATLDDGQVTADVPSPWGTHAIVMVPIDGKNHWIDTTVSQAAWDYLPGADRDRLTYMTRDTELKLMRTPAPTYADNKIEQTTVVTVAPDGTSMNRRNCVYHGAGALTRRDAWIEVPPGERRRLISQELQDANNRTRLVGLQVDEHNLHDFDQPVKAQLDYVIPKHFSGDLAKEGSLTDSQVWTRLLSFTLDPERKLPLYLGNPFESIHRYRVELPAALRFDATPAPQNVRSRWGFFTLTVQFDPKKPRQLELIMHTRLSKMRVQPKDFAAFQQFHEEVTKNYRIWLNLRTTTELADATLLEQEAANDPISANTLARLYLEHGSDDDARRVLRAACGQFDDDRGLWDLRVKAAASLEEEVEVYGEMTRRFPQDARLAVALGGSKSRLGDAKGARDILEPLTGNRSAQVRALAHYELARCSFQEDNYQGALKHLQLAGQFDAQAMSSGGPLYFKARVHEKLGQRTEAIEAYRQVTDLEAGAQDALVPLIRLELKDGKNKDALDHLRRFTLAVGNDPGGLTQAAELHLQMERVEDAFELATRARAGGSVVNTQRVLGLVYLRKKDTAKAVFHLERAEADAEVLAGLIEAHLLLGNLPRAQHHLETALSLNEEDITPDLRLNIGEVEGLLERRQQLWKAMGLADSKKNQAIKAINGYLCADRAYRQQATRPQSEPILAASFVDGINFGPAFALRGLLRLEKGQLKAAHADAQLALRHQPVDSRALYVRGRVRLERGEPGALDDLEKAATLGNRSDPVVLHWLAGALFEAGRHEEALTIQRSAVELSPTDAEMAEQLRTFEKATSNAGL